MNHELLVPSAGDKGEDSAPPGPVLSPDIVFAYEGVFDQPVCSAVNMDFPYIGW